MTTSVVAGGACEKGMSAGDGAVCLVLSCVVLLIADGRGSMTMLLSLVVGVDAGVGVDRLVVSLSGVVVQTKDLGSNG